MTAHLNETERRTLAAIVAYQQEHGFSPSLRDLALICSYSPSAVRKHLQRLEAAGKIVIEGGKARGIRVVRSGAAD